MSQKQREKVKQFILDNYKRMTKSELADGANSTPSTIGVYCIELNVEPVTLRNRALEFITKNQHLTQEEIAEKLNITKQQVRNYSIEFKIEIKTKKQAHIQAVKSMQPKQQEPIRRPPAIYTQTGSDVTDSLRGIKSTQRIFS